jgi:hypothetical protein
MGASHWQLAGTEITAPERRSFSLGLARDLDADGKVERVVWTLPLSGSGPGELWLYPASGPARKLASAPAFLPSSADCHQDTKLSQSGPRSVSVDITARCTSKHADRTVTRALVTVAPLDAQPQARVLRLAQSAFGDPFEISASDDRTTLRQLPPCRSAAPEASCNPDPSERAVSVTLEDPSAGFSRLASETLARSNSKKTSREVAGAVRAIRRLAATVCTEAGAPRIWKADGSAFSCSPLAATADRLLTAEVQAALQLSDVPGAIAALDRDGWYWEPVSEERRAALTQSIVATTAKLDVPKLVTPKLETIARSDKPRWSPLAFEADGALLVLTQRGVAKLAAPDAEPEILKAGSDPAPWPLDVRSPSGILLQKATQSCDRNDVALEFLDMSGKPVPRPRLPLLAAHPAACTGKAPRLLVVPIGWKNDTLELAIGGAHLGPASTASVGEDRTFGAPGSPDGHHLVLPTSLGLLVISQGKAELWRGDAIGDARRLSDCVVANGARAVACVEGRSVRIAVRP